MTAKQIQILAAGLLATGGEVLGKIAGASPSLQNQIPQMFPEQVRGTISLWCQTISGIAFIYALLVAHQAPAANPPLPPPPPSSSPGPARQLLLFLAAMLGLGLLTACANTSEGRAEAASFLRAAEEVVTGQPQPAPAQARPTWQQPVYGADGQRINPVTAP